MSAIITEKFRLHNASQFVESFTEASASTYYLFLGKATAFSSTTTGGSDSSSSNAGDFVNLEDFHREREDGNILLETHNVFPSRGHIPLSNFSINSSSKVTAGIVQAAEILVRNTGEIALEDATDTTNTNTDYLLEETSGDNLDLEGATGITY